LDFDNFKDRNVTIASNVWLTEFCYIWLSNRDVLSE
jgi:hypothetical protein